MPLPDIFKGPYGGEYTRLPSEPEVFTVTTHDGRVIRMFVADVTAFVDFIREQDSNKEKPCP